MEYIFYALVVIACLMTLQNWRWGVYAGITLDVLRDPIRKMAEGQSVIITVVGAVIWAVVAFQALQTDRNLVRRLFYGYPRLRYVVAFLAFAIIPAAVLSCLMYNGGYLLAAIGVVSYVAPLAGIAIGFGYARSESLVYKVMVVYTIVNVIGLIGGPLEYFQADFPALGGIDHEWIRYHQGYMVTMISGFYRSPDIMGLHAAHVIMFATLLALRKRSSQAGWLAAAVWAAFCLLLCGRRKMIGIPFVFVAAYVMLGMYLEVRRSRRILGIFAAAAAIACAAMIILWPSTTSNEYTDYATTTVTDLNERVTEGILGTAIGTLRQTGILGAGMGTATQGRYYLNVETTRSSRGWQEDALSKMLLEFGVFGLAFVLAAALALVRVVLTAFRAVPPNSSVRLLQIGLMSVVLGDVASFLVSHQHFSGDVVNSLMVTLFTGMILAGPRVHAAGNINATMGRKMYPSRTSVA